MKWCDTSDSILEWGSEEIVVPYRSPIDNKYHRYFVDFYIKVQTRAGDIKKYLIEIKPKRQTMEPPVQKKRTQKYINEVTTYLINEAKWEAAREWCADRNLEFLIFTEDHLNVK